VDLVVNHVLEALVESRAQENLRIHLDASEAVVHDLPGVSLIAAAVQLVRQVLDSDFRERSRHFYAARTQDALAE